MDISRRNFIKTTSSTLALGLAAGSPALQPRASAQQTSKLMSVHTEDQRRGDMIFRRLGKTEDWVSVIGMGGYHIGKQADENDNPTDSACNR